MRITMSPNMRALMGLLGIVIIAAFATVAVYYGNGYFRAGYELSTVFDSSAQGLDNFSDVKLRGINVGRVQSVELQADGTALVTMFLNDGVRIPVGTGASIEPLSIFGPKYISLDPPDDAAGEDFYGEDDDVDIGNDLTHEPVDFTRVLGDTTNLLLEIEPEELITIIRTLADGVSGLGPEIGSTVDDLTTVAGVVNAHSQDLQPFLNDLAVGARTLADHGDELLATAGDLHELLPEVISRPDELGNLLDSVQSLSSDVASLLEANAGDLDTAIAGLSSLVNELYTQRAQVPDLLDLLNTFFGGLAEIIRVPHPNPNERVDLLGAIAGGLSDQICEVLVDGIVCPDYGVNPLGLGGSAATAAAASSPVETPAASVPAASVGSPTRFQQLGLDQVLPVDELLGFLLRGGG